MGVFWRKWFAEIRFMNGQSSVSEFSSKQEAEWYADRLMSQMTEKISSVRVYSK